MVLRNPRVLYPVPDFRTLRVVKTLDSTDKVTSNSTDTFESHSFTYLAVYNRKRFPFIIFHFYITLLQDILFQNVNHTHAFPQNLQRFYS